MYQFLDEIFHGNDHKAENNKTFKSIMVKKYYCYDFEAFEGYENYFNTQSRKNQCKFQHCFLMGKPI